MAHEYGEQFLVKLGRQGKVVVGVIAVSEAFEGNGSVVVAKLRWVSMSDVLPTHLEHSRLWHVVNRVWSRVGKVRILGTDPPRHIVNVGHLLVSEHVCCGTHRGGDGHYADLVAGGLLHTSNHDLQGGSAVLVEEVHLVNHHEPETVDGVVLEAAPGDRIPLFRLGVSDTIGVESPTVVTIKSTLPMTLYISLIFESPVSSATWTSSGDSRLPQSCARS